MRNKRFLILYLSLVAPLLLCPIINEKDFVMCACRVFNHVVQAE